MNASAMLVTSRGTAAEGLVPMRDKPTTECSIPDCQYPAHARGFCNTHYSKWYRQQGKQLRASRDDFFFSHITVSDGGCWVWRGSLSPSGYAQMTVRQKTVRAHRWSYERFVAPIPEGLVVDHLCRNPSCVNPDHLEPVTPRENTLRGVSPAAKNAKKTHCIHGHEFTAENTIWKGETRACQTCQKAAELRYQIRIGRAQGLAVGERHGLTHLSEDQVREMRRLYATGTHSTRALASMFGVANGTVWKIVTGRSWSHIPLERSDDQ